MLVFEFLCVYFLSFFFENGFNQDSSVLELVTLGGKVELVVKSSVNLLSLSVFSEKSSQDSLSSDPQDLGGHSAFGGTSAFTGTSVVTFALGLEVESGARARVDNLFALHYQSVLDEFTNEDSGVGLSNLFDFVGIHPYTFLSALENLCCQSFLALETNHYLLN